jgi:hypothetical protein
MFRKPSNITKITPLLRRLSSSLNGSSNLPQVDCVQGPFTTLNIETFRRRGFIPEQPLLISSPGGDTIFQTFPAAIKWFTGAQWSSTRLYDGVESLAINGEYLEQFQDTILPYELITSANKCSGINNPILSDILKGFTANLDPATTFHRFNAPLRLFLRALETPITELYIAQAQIIDLPPNLRTDLPTPTVVKEAGRGDVYDANIWLGIPPTSTPLHKDPNPNLFVQLASTKEVRIFEPSVGKEMFIRVKSQLGQNGAAGVRGAEMMEGAERALLDEAVWGTDARGGFVAVLKPMDALFIPKGWWHSIKSVGNDVNASVNWWFR